MALLVGRKFLIIGGNGFVGNRVAARLINNQAQVSVLSRYLHLYAGMAPDLTILKTKKLTGSLAVHLSLNMSNKR